MTASELIYTLSRDKKINDLCFNICKGKPVHKDVYQSLFLKICEHPANELLRIHKAGYLDWWMVRVAINVHTDIFRETKVLNGYDPTTEDYNYNVDTLSKKVEEEIAQLPAYEQRLFLEYLKAGSSRNLAEQTGIPYRTIAHTVKKVKVKIKSSLNEDFSSIS